MALLIWLASNRPHTLDAVLERLSSHPFIEPEGLEAEYQNPATGGNFMFEYLGRFVDKVPPPGLELSQSELADRFCLLASLPAPGPSYTVLEAIPILEWAVRELQLTLYLSERPARGEHSFDAFELEQCWAEKNLQEIRTHLDAGLRPIPHRPHQVVESVWRWNTAVGAGLKGAAPIAFLEGGEEPATATVWWPGRAGLLPEVETLLLTSEPERPMPTLPKGGFVCVPWNEVAPLLDPSSRREEPVPHYILNDHQRGAGLLQRLGLGGSGRSGVGLDQEFRDLLEAWRERSPEAVGCLRPNEVVDSEMIAEAQRLPAPAE